MFDEIKLYLATALVVVGKFAWAHLPEADWHAILDWAVVALPTILAVGAAYLSTLRLETQASRNTWRIALVAFGIFISAITWEQQRVAREAAQSETIEDLAPDVALTYVDHQFHIENRGKYDVLLYGTHVDGGPKSIDRPRIIAPGPNSFYYLLGDSFEKEIHEKLGDNGEARVPMELYLADKKERKYLAEVELWIVAKDKNITVHTQMLSIKARDWP